MSSILIDRTDGLSSSTAMKGPCHVATTGNIALYGLQMIDGVAVAAGDRVLVRAQTAGYENGIYVVDTGQWRRAKDFSRNNDVREGTQVLVTDGTTFTRTLFIVTSSDPIVIGTDAITFDQSLTPDVVRFDTTSTAGMQFVIDEDDMASNLATKVPTQQSVKAYADSKVIDNNSLSPQSTSRAPSQSSTKAYVDNLFSTIGATVLLTRALASAATIAAGVSAIIIGGHTTFGDSPLTTYVEVPDTGGVAIDQIETNGGSRRWQIIDGPVDIRSVGIFPGTSANMVTNVSRLNTLIARQRNIFVPPADFYLDGIVRLVSGTFIHGATVNGTSWTDTTILPQYNNQSRLLFIGTRSSCFDSDPLNPLNHGSISNLVIMVPNTSQYSAIFNIFGPVSWTFSGLRMENSSPTNPSGFVSTKIGSNDTWLNRLFDVEIRLPDSSSGYVFRADWSDSVMIGCMATGGSGSYYSGPGNFEVIGGIYDRAKSGAAGWTVDKVTSSSTSIKFIGVNFDENETYGLIVSAASSPGGNFLGVLVQGCHFRTKNTGTADIVFVDHASTKMIGPVISGNAHSVSGPVRMTVNYARWDIIDSNNQSPTGAPWVAYTPSLAAGSGSFTSANAAGRYQRVGRTVHYYITVSIITNGSAGSSVLAGLPFTAFSSPAASGYNANTGVQIQGRVSTNSIGLFTAANGYPGGDSISLVVSGSYEAA